MTMPTWLQEHLEIRGLWDSDGTTRVARARRCRTCREYTLVGLDSDHCALPVAVDADPLSPAGEVAALLAGQTTYSLRDLAGRLELDRRTHFEIRGDAARESVRHDVLARHVCGQPSLGAAPGLGQPSRLVAAVVALPVAEPPF